MRARAVFRVLALALPLAGAAVQARALDPQAQRLLDEKSAEVEKLRQDVTRLESELTAARARGALGDTPEPAAQPPGTALASPSGSDTSLFPGAPARSARTPWEWILGTSAVMLLVGFVLGWRMLDRRIRRKFGGLRIY